MEYAHKGRITRRVQFQHDMQAIVPWRSLLAMIEPHYPKGERGRSPIACSVNRAAASSHDVTQATNLLHGQVSDVYADSDFRSIDRREESQNADVNWHIAMMPSKRKAIKTAKAQTGSTGKLAQTIDLIEKLKTSIRAKVVHPFHIIKNLFKYKKVSYKGIAKNAVGHIMLFALANLVILKKSLLSQGQSCVQKTAIA